MTPGGEPGDARRALARLCLAAFFAYCSYALCRSPLLPLFAQQLGAGPSMIGFVVGASTLTGILVKLPAGALSDVMGRRPLLLGGALVFAVMPFAYVTVSTLAGLVLIRLIHGNATAVFGPVASASVSDLAPADRRGRWLGSYATVQGAGQAMGPLLAGYLIAAGGFDLAFVAAGLMGVAAPIIVAGWSPGSHPAARPSRARWAEFQTGIREVAANRLVLHTSAAHAAQFVLNGALNAFLPLYGRDVIGLTTRDLGWLFAAQTVTTLAVRPVVGSLSDRVGRRSLIAAGLCLCSATIWAISVSSHGSVLGVCLLVYAAGVATTSAATSAFITDLTRRARYGAAHGVFGTIYDVGDALGPIGAGLIVAAFGYTTMFRVVAMLGLSMAVVFVMATRRGAGSDAAARAT